MARPGKYPETRTKNPEPKSISEDWIIWAAWADRVTFEEIRERTGYSEAKVIKLMRKTLKPGSFRLWRKRVSGKGTKHR
ncbi:MAG: TIGR03643 family protein, partial [Planctomycetaceae bacterium]|nr:TIGR03643 family protein [Planctomycetaceae bacterium]